jgi:hypothetical protein
MGKYQDFGGISLDSIKVDGQAFSQGPERGRPILV